MHTLRETAIYTKFVNDIFTADEQGELNTYIAQNADKGEVIPKSGGCRKIRYATKDKGKSGGVRVIYYNQLENGIINLILIYAKAKTENIPAHILKQLATELEK